MQHTDTDLTIRLLAQVRAEFDQLRWQSERIEGFLTHKATNAEAEGVRGMPEPLGDVFAMESAGHRYPVQLFDESGMPRHREDPILDVKGNPILDNTGKPLDVVMPAFRSVQFSGDQKGFQRLDTIAKRAGKVISTLKIDALDMMSGWNFSSSGECWWAVIFEVAWSGRNPLLSAKKRIWIPSDNPSTYLPYDLRAVQDLGSPEAFPKLSVPSNWRNRLPDAFVSVIDDMVVASIDTCDFLLSALSPAVGGQESEPTASNQVVVEAETNLNLTQEVHMNLRRRFKVAISYPGEHRDIVSKVAGCLKEVFREDRVFYDKYHQVELAVQNLDLKLQDIYGEQSDLIVVFLCQRYQEKDWCGLEWRAIRSLLKKKNRDEDVLYLRLNDGEVEGVLDIDGFIPVWDSEAQSIANMILQRWCAGR